MTHPPRSSRVALVACAVFLSGCADLVSPLAPREAPPPVRLSDLVSSAAPDVAPGTITTFSLLATNPAKVAQDAILVLWANQTALAIENVSLPPFASRVVEFHVALEEPGEVTVTVRLADAPQGGAALTLVLRVLAPARLVLEEARIDGSARVEIGHPFRVEARVANRGEVAARANVSAAGPFVTAERTVELAPRSNLTIAFPFPATSDEGAAVVTVAIAGGETLNVAYVVYGPRFAIDGTTVERATCGTPGEVEVAVHLRNTGEGAGRNVSVSIDLVPVGESASASKVAIGSLTVPFLGVGESARPVVHARGNFPCGDSRNYWVDVAVVPEWGPSTIGDRATSTSF